LLGQEVLTGLLTLIEINDRTYITFVLLSKLYVTNQLHIFGVISLHAQTIYRIYENVPNRDRSL
jgi:hypothetical protein